MRIRGPLPILTYQAARPWRVTCRCKCGGRGRGMSILQNDVFGFRNRLLRR
jgi:hypothetical protein